MVNPTSATSEYAMLIPSSSINLSFTRNLILSSIGRSDIIKFGSKMFTWFVTVYSIVPTKIPEFFAVSSSSNL